MKFKALTLGITLVASHLAQALPTINCGQAGDGSYLTNLASANGCHYTAQSNTGTPYTELPEDIGVLLDVPSGVNTSDANEIKNALKKVVIFADGWNSTEFKNNSTLSAYFKNKGATVAWIIPGQASSDSTISYADKIEQVIRDIKSSRAGLNDKTDMVVYGFSLGGVAARLALANIESDPLDPSHETGLLISYDAPHTGLTTPQGVVQLKPLVENYIVDVDAWINAQNPAVRSFLNNARGGLATLQNLLDEYTKTYTESQVFKELLIDNALADGSERAAHTAAIDSIGYPQNLTSIAVSNGTLMTNNTITADASNRYFNLYGRTNSGNAYGYMDFKLYPTSAGQQSVALKLGATAQVSVPYTCFFVFTCHHTQVVNASMPRSQVAAATVSNYDAVPGSYIPTPLAEATWAAGSVLTEGLPACDENTGNLSYTYFVRHAAVFTNEEAFESTPSCIENTDTNKYVLNVPYPTRTSALLENDLKYTFVPTASAFGLPVSSTVSDIAHYYNNPEQSNFDILVSVPEDNGTPTKNLSHGSIYYNNQTIDSNINAVFN